MRPEDPWGSLASQSSLISKVQTSGLLFQRIWMMFLRMTLKAVLWLQLHICIHVCTCMPTLITIVFH